MEAVEKFQNLEINFLLATDIVARGIDVHQVESVINYNFPVEDQRYVHRVGRTARAGFAGCAVTLCDDEEKGFVKKCAKKCNSHALKYNLNGTMQ
jgi:superfamily II DNA/RNA helicase